MTAPPTPTPVAIRADRCPRNATNPLTTSIAIDKNKRTTVSTLLAGRAARQHVLLDAAGCAEDFFLRSPPREPLFEFPIPHSQPQPRDTKQLHRATRAAQPKT